jgi:hypothetical protein
LPALNVGVLLPVNIFHRLQMGCTVSTDKPLAKPEGSTTAAGPGERSSPETAPPPAPAASAIPVHVAAADTASLVRSLRELSGEVGDSLSVVKGDVSHLRQDLKEECADINQTLRELRATLEILTYRDQGVSPAETAAG